MLEQLCRTHNVLPFMRRQISAQEAVFRPILDTMVDIIAEPADFGRPERDGAPVWLQLVAEGDSVIELVIVRPAADGELWAIAPTGMPGKATAEPAL